MRHRFGALPVRTSALVALSVLGLLLAGRLISGPSTVRARPPATTLAYRAPSRKLLLASPSWTRESACDPPG
jgi:hypothetical protein